MITQFAVQFSGAVLVGSSRARTDYFTSIQVTSCPRILFIDTMILNNKQHLQNLLLLDFVQDIEKNCIMYTIIYAILRGLNVITTTMMDKIDL